MNISTQISNAVSNPGDTVKQVSESHSAKWIALLVAIVGIIGNHLQTRDEMKLLQAQQHFMEHQHGSNYVAQVENQPKEK